MLRRAGAGFLASGFCCASPAWAGPIDAPTNTGPSSSQSPYLLPLGPNLTSTSILTTGDSVNLKPDGVTPYRMVGIPDGLGAYDNGNGTFTVLMNHEIAAGGVDRAHGAPGAFVSEWTIDKQTLQVLKGEDLITSAVLASGTTTFQRFCSADLPAVSAFFNATTGKGFDGRIYMNGEEVAGGRAFGTPPPARSMSISGTSRRRAARWTRQA